jgi:hypothetical protein
MRREDKFARFPCTRRADLTARRLRTELPLLTEWASFPGDNSLKVIEVIKHHMESLVTGKRTAEQVMPELVKDVSNLLPKCGG